MVRASRKRGFTLVELLVVIAIIGALIGMLLPAIGNVRETVRRSQCGSNMRQVGVAMSTHHETFKRYPPSCAYARSNTGTQLYESWSWLVYLLPFIDKKDMYDTLAVKAGVPWIEPWSGMTRHATAAGTEIPSFLCPSRVGSTDYSGQTLRGSMGRSSASMRGALTNYKAMGGSVKESLPFRLITTGTVPYGYASNHPDGVLFANEPQNGLKETDILDSKSQTIMAVETNEDKYARWILGTEATLAGLPSQNDPLRCGPTYIYNQRFYYYTPTGFDGNFGGNSALSNQWKTYLNYDMKDLSHWYDQQQQVRWGPSSRHSGVVNHLFCDGIVRGVPVTIDVAAYMFLITRAGSEQFANYLAEAGLN
jgi:prepilin-type N-terminal cleavage/methylation domain-containing protein